MPTPNSPDQPSLPFGDELDDPFNAQRDDVIDNEIDHDFVEARQDWAPPIRAVADDDRDSYLRLALVNGVGPRTLASLMDHFQSARNVLSATLGQLGQVNRIGPKIASSIREASSNDLAPRVQEHCRQNGVEILMPGDAQFPRLLNELEDPPVLLFVRGQFQPSDQLSIAMVGTRHCTHYGRTMAARIAKDLAKYGITVVSGLARGIDAASHTAAMDVDGRTIAVLGSSVTDIYPPEHDELALRILKHGVLVSETNPFAKPKAGVFPQRNRIISGLSLGVIVVEAAERSGSLITARHAGEQGRDLFAVPGPVTSRMSRGANQLIRDGAILIQDADDVIQHLGPLVERARVDNDTVIHHPAELQLNEIEQKVLQSVEPIPTDIDRVIHSSGLPVPRVLSTLSVLEMRGLIQRPSGRTVVRT